MNSNDTQQKYSNQQICKQVQISITLLLKIQAKCSDAIDFTILCK